MPGSQFCHVTCEGYRIELSNAPRKKVLTTNDCTAQIYARHCCSRRSCECDVSLLKFVQILSQTFSWAVDLRLFHCRVPVAKSKVHRDRAVHDRPDRVPCVSFRSVTLPRAESDMGPLMTCRIRRLPDPREVLGAAGWLALAHRSCGASSRLPRTPSPEPIS